MRDLLIRPDADVLVERGVIRAVEPGSSVAPPTGATVINARGRVLIPAFVDAHTHACWAGDRVDEWTRKLAGATYLELLKAGGGIMSTVRAVRAAASSAAVGSRDSPARTSRVTAWSNVSWFPSTWVASVATWLAAAVALPGFEIGLFSCMSACSRLGSPRRDSSESRVGNPKLNPNTWFVA